VLVSSNVSPSQPELLDDVLVSSNVSPSQPELLDDESVYDESDSQPELSL
jgi:hypothetical protein